MPAVGTALTTRSLSGHVVCRHLWSHGSSRRRTCTQMHAYAHIGVRTLTAYKSLPFRSATPRNKPQAHLRFQASHRLATRGGGLLQGACLVPLGPAAAGTPRPAPKPPPPPAWRPVRVLVGAGLQRRGFERLPGPHPPGRCRVRDFTAFPTEQCSFHIKKEAASFAEHPQWEAWRFN